MAWIPMSIYVAMATTVLVVSVRPLSEPRLVRWMQTRGVPVTADTHVLVQRELGRTRRWRAYGVAVPLLLQGLVAGLYGGQWPDPPELVVWLNRHATGWAPPLVGYGVGALAAEWRGARPGQAGRALVSTRVATDYISSGLMVSLRWLPVVAAVSVPLPLLVPVEPSWEGQSPTVWQLLVLALGATLAWAITELIASRIVRRAQRIGDPALVRADDALRSAAAHAVVAVGVALQLWAVSGVLWQVGASADPTPIRWIFPAAALVALGTAFGMWFGYAATSFPFAVRRPVVAAAPRHETTHA